MGHALACHLIIGKRMRNSTLGRLSITRRFTRPMAEYRRRLPHFHPDGYQWRSRRSSKRTRFWQDWRPHLKTDTWRLMAQDALTLTFSWRSEEHTSELQSPCNLVC